MANEAQDGESSDYVNNNTVNQLTLCMETSGIGLNGRTVLYKQLAVSQMGPGYITAVQKTLVINTACIITAGPGDFHNYLMKEHRVITKHSSTHQIRSCVLYKIKILFIVLVLVLLIHLYR